MTNGLAALSFNFLYGIAGQARNSPWTIFFYGIARHQKALGRSLPALAWSTNVSSPTGQTARPRSFFWSGLREWAHIT
jgi:hypothetical protein